MFELEDNRTTNATVVFDEDDKELWFKSEGRVYCLEFDEDGSLALWSDADAASGPEGSLFGSLFETGGIHVRIKKIVLERV